jgi:cell division transport system permease protein
VLARRQQVEIMARLGATDRFIATPFVIEALAEALIAGVIALGILFGAQQVLAARLIAGITFLPWTGAVAFLGGVLLLALLSGLLALGRVLRSVGP